MVDTTVMPSSAGLEVIRQMDRVVSVNGRSGTSEEPSFLKRLEFAVSWNMLEHIFNSVFLGSWCTKSDYPSMFVLDFPLPLPSSQLHLEIRLGHGGLFLRGGESEAGFATP